MCAVKIEQLSICADEDLTSKFALVCVASLNHEGVACIQTAGDGTKYHSTPGL